MIRTTENISIRLTDEAQFRFIFDKYYIALCMFANQYVEDDALAADIVQECFVKLWQLRDDFMYIHQIKSFLYTSVRNKSLNELEHTKVMNEYAQKVMEMGKESFFQDKVIAEESYRILVDAIDKLPPQMKSIMRLALEGKTNPEIAEALNISGETVHSQKKIAYRKLRGYLKDYYYLLFYFL
ncbi:RNA polymerase sigma-70 factor [uncultured Bacteroides sp.]|mgnify:FL=1|uniref:RNA polymerase sigma-70 factor n=1 Tax=uncultured Bacteroides sp. TaxID=162156 RepID=UPI00280B14B0|nr:RNA polymerase sigma-70 factor [uncultured Bacteroides sp.]